MSDSYYRDDEQDSELDNAPWDNEPEDIDDDFGYDPYAGGPEMDDLDYDDYHAYYDE